MPACHVPFIPNHVRFCPSFYKPHVSVQAYKNGNTKGEDFFTGRGGIFTDTTDPHTQGSYLTNTCNNKFEITQNNNIRGFRTTTTTTPNRNSSKSNQHHRTESVKAKGTTRPNQNEKEGKGNGCLCPFSNFKARSSLFGELFLKTNLRI